MPPGLPTKPHPSLSRTRRPSNEGRHLAHDDFDRQPTRTNTRLVVLLSRHETLASEGPRRGCNAQKKGEVIQLVKEVNPRRISLGIIARYNAGSAPVSPWGLPISDGAQRTPLSGAQSMTYEVTTNVVRRITDAVSLTVAFAVVVSVDISPSVSGISGAFSRSTYSLTLHLAFDALPLESQERSLTTATTRPPRQVASVTGAPEPCSDAVIDVRCGKRFLVECRSSRCRRRVAACLRSMSLERHVAEIA